MPKITMYSTRICPYCSMAERFLTEKGLEIHKILVDRNPQDMMHMMHITGRRTVPQIFIGEYHVGGYDDLMVLDAAGELAPLLKEETSES